MYEIYFKGCSKPVYRYKTQAGLLKRLNLLHRQRSLGSCTVKQHNRNLLVVFDKEKFTTWYT